MKKVTYFLKGIEVVLDHVKKVEFENVKRGHLMAHNNEGSHEIPIMDVISID
jgi:hypothetical protein